MLNMGSIALNGYIKTVKAALQPYIPCNLVRDSSQCYFKNSSRVHFFYLERMTLPKWRSSLVFALYCSSLPAYNEIYNWLVHDGPAWFESKYLRLSKFQKKQSWMSVFPAIF